MAAGGLGHDHRAPSGLGLTRYSGGAFLGVPGPGMGYPDCPAPLEGDERPRGAGAACCCSRQGRVTSRSRLRQRRGGEASISPSLQSPRTLVPPPQQAHVSYFWNLYSTAGGMSFYFSRFCFLPLPHPSLPWRLSLGPLLAFSCCASLVLLVSRSCLVYKLWRAGRARTLSFSAVSRSHEVGIACLQLPS